MKDYEIVNNYINENFNKVDNYNMAVSNIKSILKYITAFKDINDFDLIVNLLKNNKILDNYLFLIINNLKVNNSVKDTDYKKISSSEIFNSMFDIYCSLNNIMINEDAKLDYNTVYNSDSFKMYMQEIRKYPFLSPEEEIYYGNLSKSGDINARNKLIESNLRLVVKISFKYNSDYDILDLIQSGNLGLIRASELYDPSKGYRFSTYATWWIRQGIIRHIQNSHIIKLPSHKYSDVLKAKTAYNELLSSLGKAPSYEEVAKETGIEAYKVREYLNYNTDTISLNNKVNDEDEEEIMNFIPDERENPENEVGEKLANEDIINFINNCHLTDHEKEIIMCRYGFTTGEVMTLEQVSKMYNVTRERIRQIESKALRKLKGILNKNIEEYYDQNLLNYYAKPKNIIKEIENEPEIVKQIPKVTCYLYGINAQNEADKTWNLYYRLTRVYLSNNDNVPKNFKTKNGRTYDEAGYDIYNWLNQQLNSYCRCNLDEEKINALEDIKLIDNMWHIMYELLLTYIEVYGNYNLIKDFRTYNGIDYAEDGYCLEKWFANTKIQYDNKTLSRDRYIKFDNVLMDRARVRKNH